MSILSRKTMGSSRGLPSTTAIKALKTPNKRLNQSFLFPPDGAPAEHLVHRHQFSGVFMAGLSTVETVIVTRSFLVTSMQTWAEWIFDSPVNPLVPDRPLFDYESITGEVVILVDGKPMIPTTEAINRNGADLPQTRNGVFQIRLSSPGIIPLGVVLYQGQQITTQVVVNPITFAPTVSIEAEIGCRFMGHIDHLQSK